MFYEGEVSRHLKALMQTAVRFRIPSIQVIQRAHAPTLVPRGHLFHLRSVFQYSVCMCDVLHVYPLVLDGVGPTEQHVYP